MCDDSANGNGAAADGAAVARPRRRLRQFSLRALLLFVAVVAVWLGWWTQRARGQRQAVAALQQRGVHVAYEFEWTAERGYLDAPQPPGPAWAREMLGIDYLADVVIVNAGDCELSDEDLRHLAFFPRLRHLNLTGTSIGDDGCRHFAGLKHLAALHVGRTAVTDAGLAHFVGLAELEWTFLGQTQITDAGMKHLAGLSKLRDLNVFGTRVTHEGLAPLLKSNPDLKIVEADGAVRGSH